MAYRQLILLTGLLVLMGIMAYHYWVMERMRELMDMPNGFALKTLASVLIGLVVWLFLVSVCRWLVLAIEGLVNLMMPRFNFSMRIFAWVVSSVVVLSVLFGVTRYTLWQPALQKISQTALKLDKTNPEALDKPSSSYRTGSDAAVQSWESLGHYGQRFVSLGLTSDEISQLTGRDAKEPIRVFAGLDNEDPDDQHLAKVVEIALNELDRTDAWSRKYLVIHGATGRGWVEEYSSLTAEYLTDGDIASVSVQYSYLPSQVSYIMDSQASSRANRLLYDAIIQRLSELPADTRPKLYLAGESLGAYATQANFKDINELIHGLDGAVWVGTPRFSPLWENLVASRMKGTTEGLPIIDGGRHVRFMDYPDMLGKSHPQKDLYENWDYPRVVFVQYASDPIVWWSPKMIYTRPDWMREPAGRDVAKVPIWVPVISLWELSLDMPAANNVSAGHGHIYRYDTIHAWQAVLGKNDEPETKQMAEKIGAAIDERIERFVPERSD